MDLRELLLVGHILGVVVMAFGSGAALFASVAAGSNPDVPTVYRMALIQAMVGRVVPLAAVVVLLLGTWLVIEVDAWEFSQGWISGAYVLWFITMGVGGMVEGRHGSRVLANAKAAMDRGERTNDALVAEFTAPITKIGGTFLGLMYVVFVVLMVVKPGA